MLKPLMFLYHCKAHETPHSGRTLLAHLMGTEALLRSWDAPDYVCLAGLFHSIYGTVQFRHQSWPLDDRATIRSVIGDAAESLAFCFCTLDRPSDLEALAVSERNERRVIPPRSWLANLLEIEAANLIEQGGSPWLPRLAPFVSDGARHAIETLSKT